MNNKINQITGEIKNLDDVKNSINDLDGKAGLYYYNLKDGSSYGINENESFIAASVIKIPVMIELFRECYGGKMNFSDTLLINEKEKAPEEGAIAYMHDGAEVTLQDLCNLMIILSDNTATNMLINHIGIDNINDAMAGLEIHTTMINRLLFDDEAEMEGKHNYISPKEIGILLKLMYDGELINKEASSKMLEILKLQQVNYKMPYLLPKDIKIAHKTGDDPGITHDMGIVFAKDPFIICFASNETYVPKADDFIRKAAKFFYEKQICRDIK